MLGFSLQKLLVLGIILAAVWYGFKWVGRYQKLQNAKTKNKSRSKVESEAEDAGDRIDAAEDMVPCAVCGTYVVAAEARCCDRADCPYPV